MTAKVRVAKDYWSVWMVVPAEDPDRGVYEATIEFTDEELARIEKSMAEFDACQKLISSKVLAEE